MVDIGDNVARNQTYETCIVSSKVGAGIIIIELFEIVPAISTGELQ